MPPEGFAVRVTLSPGFMLDAVEDMLPGDNAESTVILSTEEHFDVPEESVTSYEYEDADVGDMVYVLPVAPEIGVEHDAPEYH